MRLALVALIFILGMSAGAHASSWRTIQRRACAPLLRWYVGDLELPAPTHDAFALMMSWKERRGSLHDLFATYMGLMKTVQNRAGLYRLLGRLPRWLGGIGSEVYFIERFEFTLGEIEHHRWLLHRGEELSFSRAARQALNREIGSYSEFRSRIDSRDHLPLHSNPQVLPQLETAEIFMLGHLYHLSRRGEVFPWELKRVVIHEWADLEDPFPSALRRLIRLGYITQDALRRLTETPVAVQELSRAFSFYHPSHEMDFDRDKTE